MAYIPLLSKDNTITIGPNHSGAYNNYYYNNYYYS